MRIVGAVPIAATDTGPIVCFVRCEYTSGEGEVYVLALAFVPDSAQVKLKEPLSVLAALKTKNGDGRLVDALEEGGSSYPLIEAILAQRRFRAGPGEVVATSTINEEESRPLGDAYTISATHANAAIRYGDRFILKVFRRVEDGISPEYELGRFLAARVPGLTPPVVGALEYRVGRKEPSTLAVLQGFVPNEGTAWDHAREELGRFYDRVLTRPNALEHLPAEPIGNVVALSLQEPPTDVAEAIGHYREQAVLLGRRTAELHLALASERDDPAFAPEPYSSFDRRSLYQGLRNQVGRTLRTLRGSLPNLPSNVQGLARMVIDAEPQILIRFERLLHQRISALRIRCHGDYHLGQVLFTGKDFVIIDFEGGGDATLSERRRKRSPLRDVAGMVRSFHYASYTALLDGGVREADRVLAERWTHLWHMWVSAAFLRGYCNAANDAGFLPQDQEQLTILFDRFVLAKAFRELSNELIEPGERVLVPLHGIAQMLDLLQRN
jgi:maltose alpha-D-glucosyltransferase/alpha-amylase